MWSSSTGFAFSRPPFRTFESNVQGPTGIDMASSAPSSPSPHQQQFCLRWNNHQSALVSVFDHLLQSEAFVDVTLAVEGLLLRAHKLVLSACSPYFQAVFASHPAKHPIIILKDVRYADLRALLDFMYRGEVAVDQDHLPAFLRLAESLKIRGLAEFCEESLSQATGGGSQPPIFDSLLDSQKSSSFTKRVNNEPVVQNSSAVQVLPVLHQHNQRAPVMDFSAPTLATRSSSSLSGSACNKRPSSPQTYAHHRRKRGRPPRQSYSESAGLMGSDKSTSPNVKSLSDSARGGSTSSPEVMEMNVDMPDGGNKTENSSPNTHEPTNNSSAHETSLTAQDDEKGSRDSSPLVVPFGNGKLVNHSTEVQVDTRQQQQDLDPLTSPLPGKGSKRARGRPRGYGRNAGSLDRSSSGTGISHLGAGGGASADSLEDLAGPSSSSSGGRVRDSETPDRTLLGSSGSSVGHLHHHNRDSGSTEQLQEMSIRGLNLFRYASVSEEGMYRCLPCEKDHVTRTFKNKYSFQRHAYLYHEGNQRKVFPCLVCGREFSRPDKLKHHLKTVHDYAVPREYSNAYYALP